MWGFFSGTCCLFLLDVYGQRVIVLLGMGHGDQNKRYYMGQLKIDSVRHYENIGSFLLLFWKLDYGMGHSIAPELTIRLQCVYVWCNTSMYWYISHLLWCNVAGHSMRKCLNLFSCISRPSYQANRYFLACTQEIKFAGIKSQYADSYLALMPLFNSKLTMYLVSSFHSCPI